MSTPIGKKIRNIRERLEMGRAEFAEKTGINKATLIGVETRDREIMSSILEAVATAFPQYAAYLLTDDTQTKQKNPEEESISRELPKAKKAS